jgi:hypothetical protein
VTVEDGDGRRALFADGSLHGLRANPALLAASIKAAQSR